MNKVFRIKLFADRGKATEFKNVVKGELLDYNNPKDKETYEIELELNEGSFDPDMAQLFPFCVCWIED